MVRAMQRFLRTLLWTLVVLLVLPVATLLASWLQGNAQAWEILAQMGATVLPDYAWTSLLLCGMVSLGVISMGTVSAAAVTLFDFPFRKTLEWALLLPLAMPAYVVAYAYTDFLQYSGTLQTWLRSTWGLQGALLPEVRSVWGAAAVLALSLYPYVYLLTRTALSDRANHLMEAARLLGASLRRRIWQVALPLARPAIAAGTALALMETLADFGVSSYFGIQTFTAGIYKAWIVMDDHVAAAQLSTALLLLVACVLGMELHAQSKMRFSSGRADRQSAESNPIAVRGVRAFALLTLCALPVVFGFVLPLGILAIEFGSTSSVAVPWDRFFQWGGTSLALGLITAVLAVGVAVFVAVFARVRPAWDTQLAQRAVGLGYSVPGVVVVIGLLLPVGWLQSRFPDLGLGYWLTATSLGMLWAYLVRFVAVAMQSVQSGFTRIAPALDESSRMLGVTAWTLLTKVHAPLLRKPLFAASLLVLVDVMKELPVTLVLRPFDTDTLAVMAYQLARDERLGEAALPSLALVIVGLVPVFFLSRTLRRGEISRPC